VQWKSGAEKPCGSVSSPDVRIAMRHTPQPVPAYDIYGHLIDVPQENLFGIAGIMVLLTLIPLYFGGKEYRKRIG
jgi:hypothetical protein